MAAPIPNTNMSFPLAFSGSAKSTASNNSDMLAADFVDRVIARRDSLNWSDEVTMTHVRGFLFGEALRWFKFHCEGMNNNSHPDLCKRWSVFLPYFKERWGIDELMANEDEMADIKLMTAQRHNEPLSSFARRISEVTWSMVLMGQFGEPSTAVRAQSEPLLHAAITASPDMGTETGGLIARTHTSACDQFRTNMHFNMFRVFVSQNARSELHRSQITALAKEKKNSTDFLRAIMHMDKEANRKPGNGNDNNNHGKNRNNGRVNALEEDTSETNNTENGGDINAMTKNKQRRNGNSNNSSSNNNNNGNNGNGNGGNNRNGYNANATCSYCKRKGHATKDCRTKKRDLARILELDGNKSENSSNQQHENPSKDIGSMTGSLNYNRMM